jgi:hypothetical protein
MTITGAFFIKNLILSANYPTFVIMPLFTSRKQKKDFKLSFQDDMLFVEQPDGKQQAYPLTWMPRLKNASAEEQADWVFTEKGIRWEKLDVEITLP